MSGGQTRPSASLPPHAPWSNNFPTPGQMPPALSTVRLPPSGPGRPQMPAEGGRRLNDGNFAGLSTGSVGPLPTPSAHTYSLPVSQTVYPGPIKKKSRQASGNEQISSPHGSATANKQSGSPLSPPKDAKDSKDAQPPSILVREKKQKACANCRRAKLKCIVEDGETDCVRCRARKERCVFYPRGHDEDWQQTLTNDVYTAISHLSQLSAAVHHILAHLSTQGVVPPLERAIERYEAPERDLSILQGWGVERNRELQEGSRKRRRVKKEEDDEYEEDDEEPGVVSFTGGDTRKDLPQNQSASMPPPQIIHPSDVHLTASAFVQDLTPSTAHLAFQHNTQTSSLSMSQDVESSFTYPLPSPHSANGGNQPLPHIGPVIATPVPSSAPLPQLSTTHVTPTSLSSISPIERNTSFSLVPTEGNMQTQHPLYPNQQGIFGLLNGNRPSASPDQGSTETAIATFTSDDLGSVDPRPNIVKRGLISNNEALGLVTYFHTKLSPWLFGYRLEFTKFPYIPQGPSVITPFILSVMCLVAAERVPQAHEHRPLLAREVTQLLVNSPADSFISTLDQPFGGGTGAKDDDGEEELDPELGIGPEEIVGACILATFMNEREQAATIASSAFKWARGWIKWTSLTVPLPPTLGEVCGLLPIKRDATREDMARVWLLCYIVDGTEALQRDNPAPPRRDPMAYCHVLVPDSPLPGDSYPPHDILLTFHARLITLLRDWYHRRSQIEAAAGPSSIAQAQAASHARLASSINASLEWWRADLESHSLEADWMRHIDLFWEFARMLVNATSAKSLGANPRLRAASWAHGVEAAVGFLEKCCAWPSREELANLPPCYLSMITLAGSVLVDAIKDQGVAECPFQAEDAVHLLNNVADILRSGGLPSVHVSRTAGATLRSYADQLARNDRR